MLYRILSQYLSAAILPCLKDETVIICSHSWRVASSHSGKYCWKDLLGREQDTVKRTVSVTAFQGQLPVSQQQMFCFLSLKNLPCRAQQCHRSCHANLA